MPDRNMAERLREGLDIARRSYERPGDSFFWPDDPDQQAWMIRWLSGIVHESRWPTRGREAAYHQLIRLAAERETLKPAAREALRTAAEEALAAGAPPKATGRPSTAWRDKAIVDMFGSLKRQGYQRHVAVGLLAQAADIDKDTSRGVLRTAGID